MTSFLPLVRIRERISNDKEDSDNCYFMSLLYGCELITKLITAAFVASIQDDPDRQRYRYEYQLVRASGLGDWIKILSEIATGPASSLLDKKAIDIRNEMTKRVPAGDWRNEACIQLYDTMEKLNLKREAVPQKVSLMTWFDYLGFLRNKTRGHGAPNQKQVADACIPLYKTFDLMADHLSIFKQSWAYIRRNLSGKFRVCPMTNDTTPFNHIKSERDFHYADGVYIALDVLHHVRLVYSSQDLDDFYVANGGMTNERYEALSYISGNRIDQPAKPFLKPIDPLPASKTEGFSELDVIGNVFSNMPPVGGDYIVRKNPETALKKQLLSIHHHPIVTMSGRGGIGKTSLALHVLHQIVNSHDCPYQMVIWFSARDIDLFPESAKVVRPAGTTIDDFSKTFCVLMGQEESDKAKRRQVLESYLQAQAPNPPGDYSGPVLFVFDNFETLSSPSEAFEWIDTYIRPPNKVLITTRMRWHFQADYPIQIEGMEPEECQSLIQTTISRLNLSPAPNHDVISALIKESGGHPFIIKVLLGQWAKDPTIRTFEHSLSNLDEILESLFERTFDSLAPFVKRIFLALCGWRSLVPEIAIEAIYMQPEEEYIDIPLAIEDLVKSSLVVEVRGADEEVYLSVPLAAQVFGRKKLEIAPDYGTIRNDIRLLQQFGTAQKNDIATPLVDRLYKLFHNIAQQVSHNSKPLDSFLPLIQTVAKKMPRAWLDLAQLYSEIDPKDTNHVRECLVKYVENAGRDDPAAWLRLANIYKETGNRLSEIHALVELAKTSKVSIYQISDSVNRINGILRSEKWLIPSDSWRPLASEMAQVMYLRRKECNATDLSRLAWLYMSLQLEDRAWELVRQGLAISPENRFCLNLKELLEHG